MSFPLRVFSYSACSTCKKALNWLDKNNIKYELIDIVKSPPQKDAITKAISSLGDKKYLFNTRGKSYRDIGSEVVRSMTNHQAIEALSSDGKLIKRPFVITSEDRIILGFNENDWEDFFLS